MEKKNVQKSYVMIKPGFANSNKIIKYVMDKFNEMGLVVTESGFVRYTKDTAAQHYSNKVKEKYYPEIEEYITSEKAFGMVVEGEDSIAKIHEVCGDTKNPAIGTIRFEIPLHFNVITDIMRNVIHSSDSEENAKKEIEIFTNLYNEMCYNDYRNMF